MPSLSVRIGVALAILVAIMTAAYWAANDPHRNIVVFFGAAVAAAGQLATAFYASRTLRLALEVERDRLDLERARTVADRVSLSYTYAARWTDGSMFTIRKHSQDIVNKGMTTHGAVSAFIEEDPDRKSNIGNMLNFLEDLALSVNTARCDDAIARRLFCGILLNTWNVTEEWVKHQRTVRGRPQLWVELETLHRRWSN